MLFPRARLSKKSIQNLVHKQLEVVDLIVYNNTIKRNFKLDHQDYLLFTSPLNAQAFLEKYSLAPSQTVVAIGSTTSTYLLKQGIHWVQTAERPEESAMLEILNNIPQ